MKPFSPFSKHISWKCIPSKLVYSFSSALTFLRLLWVHTSPLPLHHVEFRLHWLQNWSNFRMSFFTYHRIYSVDTWRTCRSLKCIFILMHLKMQFVIRYFLFELFSPTTFSSSLALCLCQTKLSKHVYKVKRISFQHILQSHMKEKWEKSSKNINFLFFSLAIYLTDWVRNWWKK